MKIIKKILILFFALFLLLLIVFRNPIRTLCSFRKISNTDMYCMDYYGNYNIDKVYEHGVDVKYIELSLIKIYFPFFLAPFIYKIVVSKDPLPALPASGCSVISCRNKNRDVIVGRNFEFEDDSFLLLKIKVGPHHHSVVLLDMAYLNLSRKKLKNLSFINRCRLLFAPYVVEDGMNDKGPTVAEMCTGDTMMHEKGNKPDIFESLLFRVILDYAGSVDEAIEVIKRFNIHFLYCLEHFMVTDSQGNSAVFEYTNNNMEVIKSSGNYQIATNHILYGNTQEQNENQCSRYKKAEHFLDSLKGNLDLKNTTSMMKELSDQRTIWTSIYNLTTGSFFIACKRDYSMIFEDRIILNRKK